MHHPTDRIAHTTAFVTPVVEHWLEREIAQWVVSMRGTASRNYDRQHLGRTETPALTIMHGTRVEGKLMITSILIACPLMVQWVVGSIHHGGTVSYFSIQSVLHDYYNKGRGR